MPFILVLVGVAILLSARNGNLGALGTMLKGDIFGQTGQAGFIYWIVAVGVIGAIGYIKPIRPLANTFLALVILVLFLSNGGFFGQFNAAIKTLGTANASPTPQGTSSVPSVTLPAVSGFGSGP